MNKSNTYTCDKRISKDGKLYQVGDTIELTAKRAKDLPVTLVKVEEKENGTNNNTTS